MKLDEPEFLRHRRQVTTQHKALIAGYVGIRWGLPSQELLPIGRVVSVYAKKAYLRIHTYVDTCMYV